MIQARAGVPSLEAAALVPAHLALMASSCGQSLDLMPHPAVQVLRPPQSNACGRARPMQARCRCTGILSEGGRALEQACRLKGLGF